MNLISKQFLLKFYSNFFAKKRGIDNYGNIYYSKKNNSPKNNYREERWVIYKGEVEASKVPPEWNAWLHHASNLVPKSEKYRPHWIKDHKENTRRKIDLDDLNFNNSEIKKTYEKWDPNAKKTS
tara:strand:+ start:5151 stop:5522 length:372 start_codon:yes stop_codon:yes gene_type:complete